VSGFRFGILILRILPELREGRRRSAENLPEEAQLKSLILKTDRLQEVRVLQPHDLGANG